MNSQASDYVAVVATIDPDVYTAAAYTSDYVAVKDFHHFMAVIMAGTLGASATLDAKIVQATDSGGTGSKDVSGYSITQMTQAGTDQSDTQAVINIDPDALDLDNNFDYIAITMTVGTATSDAGALLVGYQGRNGPASDNDLASVGEIV